MPRSTLRALRAERPGAVWETIVSRPLTDIVALAPNFPSASGSGSETKAVWETLRLVFPARASKSHQILPLWL